MFLRFLYYTLSQELSQRKVTSADKAVCCGNFSAFSQFLCAISPFTNVCGCRRSMDHSLRTAFHSSLYLCAFTHLSACDKSPQHECLTQHSRALYQLPRAWSADTSCLLLRRSRGSCEESVELHAHLEDQLGRTCFETHSATWKNSSLRSSSC